MGANRQFDGSENSEETENIHLQIQQLENDYQDYQKILHQRQVQQQGSHHLTVYQLHSLEDALVMNINDLDMKKLEILEEIQGVTAEIERKEQQITRFSQLTSINDAFHIWFLGPFGTINNFRLGSLPTKAIDVNEINAGFGQAALVLETIANVTHIEFKHFYISPLGNFAKIIRVDDKRYSYPLYIEQASIISFWPKKNFNIALNGFMNCVLELGDYVASYDPTMTMPYRINLAEAKIGDIPFVYGVDDEVWTKALKFMLTNVKWIIAWYTKHGNLIVTTK